MKLENNMKQGQHKCGWVGGGEIPNTQEKKTNSNLPRQNNSTNLTPH